MARLTDKDKHELTVYFSKLTNAQLAESLWSLLSHKNLTGPDGARFLLSEIALRLEDDESEPNTA